MQTIRSLVVALAPCVLLLPASVAHADLLGAGGAGGGPSGAYGDGAALPGDGAAGPGEGAAAGGAFDGGGGACAGPEAAPVLEVSATLDACEMAPVAIDGEDLVAYQTCCLGGDGQTECTVFVDGVEPIDALADVGDGLDGAGGGAGVDGAEPAPQVGAGAVQTCDIYQGHQGSTCQGYDIWNANCHTAANNFCRLNPDKRDRIGILACGGDPTTSPAHHTANWEVRPDGTACIYNWGTPCCWATDGAIPPDVSSGQGQVCAQRACNKQYGGETRVLPPGQLVEDPGHAACVASQAMKDQFGSSLSGCFGCCDWRSNYWSDWCAKKPGPQQSACFAQRQMFVQQCKTFCNGYHGGSRNEEAARSLAQATGHACWDAAAWWRAGSYYEQCRGCCLDKAGTDYARDQYPQCVAQCGSP